MKRLWEEKEIINPEKMGTSMWINREYPMCDQDRDCVQQFAHLVGIVLENSSPTTGMVEGMLTEKYL